MDKINATTYQNIVKDNPKDLLVLEVGDSKDLTKFQPQVKICKWGDTENDNECNVSIRLKEDKKEAKETPIIVEEDGKIKYKKSKREAHFYDIAPNEEHPEGAFETEIILLEKPDTNVVEFTLADKDVEYWYQPALTKEEIKRGCIRPDNVVGSYIVQATSKKINYVGGKEYKCGMVGPIFRPKIIDSIGTEVWGDLYIENGILSVTIPQDFLDKAVYPVRHAAGLTFGYTTLYTSYWTSTWSEVHILNSYTAGAGESITMFSVGGRTAGSVPMTAYVVAAGHATTRMASPTTVTTATAAGWNDSGAVSIALTNGVVYGTSKGSNTTFQSAYGNSGNSAHQDVRTGGGQPDPFAYSGGSGERYSMYATYTAGGGASGPVNLKSRSGNLKANIKSISGNLIANCKSLSGNA